MERKIDFVFNSEKESTYQLASGYISKTTVHFEKENVLAEIQAKGCAEFFDADGVLIAAGSVSAEEDGRGVYEEVTCRVDGKLLKLSFPICQWIDNYPHCDGEYDRWDKKILGFHTLTLDLENGSIIGEVL